MAFIAKLSDVEGEAAETQVWLDFSHKCGYLSEHDVARLTTLCDGTIGRLVTMITNAHQWKV